MAQKKNDKYSSQSSDKLLLIIEYLADRSTSVRLQDISIDLNIPRATTLRYLNALVNQRYAYQEEDTMRYALTWRICRLSHKLTSVKGIRDIAVDFLRDLSRDLCVGACIVMRTDDELHYLDIVDKPGNVLRTLQRIGKNAPMHATASGKVILSGLPVQYTERIAEVKGLEQLTPKTITQLPDLVKEIQKVRSQGYAMDNEECEVGVRGLSVPVYDYTDTIAAALSIFWGAEDFGEKTIKNELSSAALNMARKISCRLGSNIS